MVTSTSDIVDVMDKAVSGFLKKDIPSSLYHYTNYNGLNGILNSRQLWFTHYKQLNDTSEILHGMDQIKNLAKKILQVREKELIQPIRPESRFLNTFNSCFDKLPYIFYVFSACDQSNHLPAWYQYGDLCRGFAIEFASDILQNAQIQVEQPLGSFSFPAVVGRVHYNVENMAPIVEELFRTANLSQYKNDSNREKEEATGTTLATALIQLACFLKTSAFSNEREIRILSLTGHNIILPEELKIFSSADPLRPYVNITERIASPYFFHDKVKSITAGPCNHKAAFEHGIRTLLKRYNYEAKSVKIFRSDIPFR